MGDVEIAHRCRSRTEDTYCDETRDGGWRRNDGGDEGFEGRGVPLCIGHGEGGRGKGPGTESARGRRVIRDEVKELGGKVGRRRKVEEEVRTDMVVTMGDGTREASVEDATKEAMKARGSDGDKLAKIAGGANGLEVRGVELLEVKNVSG